MTKICGESVATAEQMAAYLLSVNPAPLINMSVKDFCQLYLDTAAKEGVRGDAMFAQSCKETGNFKFCGTVKPEQNNFVGLGTTDPNTPGASFPDAATGILAQAQHAKAYATKEPLSCPCVDLRHHLLVKYGKVGTAENWEELGGKWAVPGYDTKKYKSLKEADAFGDSYGYQIINILDKILKIPKTEESQTMGEKKIIALDAGHGMNTPGKWCLKSIDPNQTREWWLNDRIADRLQELLATYNCTVVRVDDTTGAKDISLSTRVKTANNAKADMYISIHHNAGINGRSGGGTVVYYYSGKDRRRVQAMHLYDSITARTGLVGNRSSKVIKNGFYVIKNTTMPAFLIENGFMDSTTDTPIILTQAHAEKTAQGILDFLVARLNLKKSIGGQSQGAVSTGNTTGSSTEQTESACYPAYAGKKTTLYNAMTALGMDVSYANRKLIAKANDITVYVGTAAQNTQMYNLLVAGLLKKV